MLWAALPLLGVDTWAQLLWLPFVGKLRLFCLFLVSKYIPIATCRVVRFFPAKL